MSNALAKINARVNQLQKKHPKSKRVTLQKQAGREYKAGKLGGVRRKRVARPKKHKKTHKKTAGPKRHSRGIAAIRTNSDRTDRKQTTITIGSVASHMNAAKKKLKYEIGMKEADKLSATSAKSRRKIQKAIAVKKAMYRKLV